MFLVQEPTGVLIQPLATSLMVLIWETINALNLWAIPVIVTVIVVSFKSRGMGADEGNAQVFALKEVERNLLWFFLVLFLFCIPLTDATSPEVRGYRCGMETGQFVDPGVGILPNGMDATIRVPIAYGLINNFSVAFGGTLSGMMYCTSNSHDINKHLMETMRTETSPLSKELETFANRCYYPARRRIQSALLQGNIKRGEDFQDFHHNNLFNGENYMNSYMGINLGNNQIAGNAPITMTISKSQWSGPTDDRYVDSEAGLLGNSYNINCTQAARWYRVELGNYLEDKFGGEVDAIHRAQSEYPKADGSYQSRSETLDYLAHGLFIKEATAEYQHGVHAKSTNVIQRAVESAWDSIFGDNKDLGPPDTAPEASSGAGASQSSESAQRYGATGSYSLNKIASAITNLYTRAEASFVERSIYIFLPIALSVTLGIVYMAAPILIILSGYNFKVVTNTMAIIFFASTAGYVTDVAYTMNQTIVSVAVSLYGDTGSNFSTDGQFMRITASTTVCILLAFWAGMCGLLGMNLGSFMNALLGQYITTAGKQSYNTAMQVGNKAGSLVTGSVGKGLKGMGK